MKKIVFGEHIACCLEVRANVQYILFLSLSSRKGQHCD